MPHYSVQALGPESAQLFVDFLSDLDFSHRPHWASCFCRFYFTDCSQQEWQKRSSSQNRQEALASIRDGAMKGFLAFDGDRCIGWCNANDAEMLIRLRQDLAPYSADGKLGCVICFVIHPDYRSKGVARVLLRHAVECFKAKGYHSIVALPFENAAEPQIRYRGTLRMYQEMGFEQIEEDGDIRVMRLKVAGQPSHHTDKG
ncbi:MAG: GNAT family N-acetyltransferase [Chitinivibrionales bacterium]|nr:GNAT family N-acetyltransferase [Chitinivibrionales bacterium]